MSIEPAWENKCWGRTRCIEERDDYSMHLLELQAGGFCSFHYHKQRANKFRVISGIVRVVFAYGWNVQWEELKATDEFVMPSLVPHQFQVIEAGEMEEEYYPDRGDKISNADIVRLSIGSKVLDPRFFVMRPGIRLADGTLWKVGLPKG